MVTIAVSGPPGSGKSTQAKLISSFLNLEYFSAGSVFREIARLRGVSIEELSRIATSDPSIDLEIDRMVYERCLKGNVVLDGHLVGWVVGDIADLKIYLTASLMVRAKRISARDGVNLDVAFNQILIRENTQRNRFIKFYGYDPDDLSVFDLVVNTDNLGVQETFEIIKRFIEKNLKQ